MDYFSDPSFFLRAAAGADDDDGEYLVQCNGVAAHLTSTTIPYDLSFVEFLGVFYTIVQFSYMALLATGMVYTQRFSLGLTFILGLIGSGINEQIIKKITKEGRPFGSCIDTNGFPSGHALVSMYYFVFLTLESIFHPTWKTKKRIIFAIGNAIILIPVGPLRRVLHDHSWKQIGVGMGSGVVWGIISWLFVQFVLVRYLYNIMGWRITQFLHIRNDLRPNFEYSKHEGKKVEDAKVPRCINTKRWNIKHHRNPLVVNSFHIGIILMWISVGIIGIVLGFEKERRDQNCDRTSKGVMISCGCLTIITWLLFIPIAVLINRKMKKQDWHPELVQGNFFVIGFLFWQSLFFCSAVFYSTTDDENCPASGPDLGMVFAILYVSVTFIFWVFVTLMFFLVDLRRLYGFNSPTNVEGQEKTNPDDGLKAPETYAGSPTKDNGELTTPPQTVSAA
eukprot:TRINITY_DN9171_c0_g1_i1.p1 TRINITY_DN9171_c0_g1~~TRINITY_DN9171_c0_g1_i1.p1  ORF type:complete len:449 (-),score=94.75 TRINITY_DN9171_c0_g1_i1:54-1400(-)